MFLSKRQAQLEHLDSLTTRLENASAALEEKCVTAEKAANSLKNATEKAMAVAEKIEGKARRMRNW